MAALREDYERSLSVNSASQKDLQENLISAKHELLRVQEQLSLAEKVRPCGVDRHLKSTRVGYVSHSCFHVFYGCLSAGVGQEVPANCGLPQHEGDPDQEERADQRDQETVAEVSGKLTSSRAKG